MAPLLLVAANFFILIICLMGVQSCYFKRRWMWFWLMLVCVLLSGTCIGVVFYGWLFPDTQELQGLNLRPTTPL